VEEREERKRKAGNDNIYVYSGVMFVMYFYRFGKEDFLMGALGCLGVGVLVGGGGMGG
jgi:hypothetical protein